MKIVMELAIPLSSQSFELGTRFKSLIDIDLLQPHPFLAVKLIDRFVNPALYKNQFFVDVIDQYDEIADPEINAGHAVAVHLFRGNFFFIDNF